MCKIKSMRSVFSCVGGAVFMVFLFALAMPVSFAQESSSVPKTLSAEEVTKLVAGSDQSDVQHQFMLATVEIYDAKLVEQNAKEATVSFLLANGQGIQSNVAYGVRLLRLGENDAPEALSGIFLAPEKVTLGANERLSRTFTFAIPASLAAGKYEIQVIANNPSGLNLASVHAGTMTQSGSASMVKVNECFVIVEGEEPVQVYSLDQGVDIAEKERLGLVCKLTNTSDTAITFSPSFTTYRRNVESGIEVKAEDIPAGDAMTLNKAESKSFFIHLPKAPLPQSYDVKVLLSDQSGTPITSDFLIVHYVLRGASGTLQNILFDKDTYQAGDTAHATVTFSGAADAFLGARGSEEGTQLGAVTVELALMSADGKSCSDAVSKSFTRDDSIQQELTFAVTRDCQYPTLHARLIKADDGIVLDEVSASLAPVGKSASISQETPQSSTHLPGYSSSLLAVIVILGGLLIVLMVKLMRSRKHFPIALFVFSLAASWLVGAGESRAGTVVITDNRYYRDVVTYSLDKSAYNVGDTMNVSISGYYSIGCGNRAANIDSFVSPNQSVGYTRANDSDGPSHGGVLRTETVVIPGYCDEYHCVPESTYTYTTTAPLFQPAGYTPYSGNISFSVPASGWTTSSPYASFLFENYGHGHGSRMMDNYYPGAPIYYSIIDPLPVLTFTASPNPISYNTAATLTWSATNATSCTAGGAWSGTQAVSGSVSTGNLTTAQTYTLYCTGPNGNSATKTITVGIKAPSVSFKINGSSGPLNLTKGDMRNFTWTATDATSCTAFSSDGWSGSKSVPSGSESLVANTTSDHTLICDGPGGSSAPQHVMVNVSCIPVPGTYAACDCSTETKTRSNLLASCLYGSETIDCDAGEKNACRNFNWKEIKP